MHGGGAREGKQQSPAAPGRGPSQGQPSALGPCVALPALGCGPWQCPASWVSVFSGWGRGTEWPPRGRGQRAAGRVFVLQTRPRGRPGPSSVYVPRTDGLRAGGYGQRHPAAELQTLPSVMRGPTLLTHIQATAHGAGPVGGDEQCGGWSVQTRALGSRHAGVQASPCARPDPPAPRPWSTRPQPCAPSRGGGLPCLDGPRERGPRSPGWGPRPEGQRGRGDRFIFIRKATKKKRVLCRRDPGRARGAWTRPPGGGGARLQSRQAIKKALRSSRVGPGPGLRYPCSPRPRPSRCPARTPGSTSPAPPAPAGTGSPSALWRPSVQTGWPTAPAGGAGVSGGPASAHPQPHPGPPDPPSPSASAWSPPRCCLWARAGSGWAV